MNNLNGCTIVSMDEHNAFLTRVNHLQNNTFEIDWKENANT